MTPKPRKHKTFKGVKLVANLYPTTSGKSLKYVDPRTKKEYGMGADPVEANRQAKQANSLLVADNTLVTRMAGQSKYNLTIKEFIEDVYRKVIAKRDYSDSWRYNIKIQLDKICESSAGKVFLNDDQYDINLEIIADFLDSDKPRYSNQLRSRLIDVYKYAISKGKCRENVAAATIEQPEDKLRNPLSKAEFWKLYDYLNDLTKKTTKNSESLAWLINAMELSFIGEYGANEVVNIKMREDIRDGWLYAIRKKTKKRNHLAYQRRKIGPWLQQVIDRCQDDILSPYLIHRIPIKQTAKQRENLPHRTYVTPRYLSSKFSKYRDDIGIQKNLIKKERATYHEIRGLSIHEHEKQNLNAQLAAGHKKKSTTDNYRKDQEEIIWTNVIDELDFKKCKS